MASEPDRLVLKHLREIRAHVDTGFKGLKGEVAENSKRIGSLRQAMLGESALGRYTVAEVAQRLEKNESRRAALEQRDQ